MSNPVRGLVVSLVVLTACIGLTPSPAAAQSGMYMRTGSYTGNAADARQFTGLGFQPDVVIVKGDVAQFPVVRTSTMSGDLTKLVDNVALAADLVQSLDSDGFTVGTNAKVNANGSSYYWVAFKAYAGEMAVGSYAGNGSSQTISSVGFQADALLVMSSGADEPVLRTSTMASDFATQLDAEAGGTGRVTSLTSNGFTVGSNAMTNGSGKTYHWVAWKVTTGKVNVGSYTGDGADGRNISTVGFQPEYLIVKGAEAVIGVSKTAATAGTDTSMQFTNTTNITNAIQALQSGGFQVGSDDQTNRSGKTFHWLAFAFQYPCDTVTNATSVAAKGGSGAATLYWASSPALILRSDSAFGTEAPSNGTKYSVDDTGGALGAAAVVNNATSAATSFTQTGLINNTPYYYKVFARHASQFCFAAGASSTEIAVRPAAGNTAWSFGVAGGSMLNAGIAGVDTGTINTAGNSSLVAIVSTTDGTPTWAPPTTTSAVQGWLTWIPLSAGGTAIIAADQGGKVYSLDASTGNQNWSITLSGGEAVQAGVAAQMRQWSDSNFVNAYGGGGATYDVLFVATNNTGTQTANKVYALRSDTGATLWTFAGGGNPMDRIVGMPLVDYSRNRLYVGSRAGDGSQISVWALDTTNNNGAGGSGGTLWNTYGGLSHIEVSPSLSYDGATIYVGGTDGRLSAITASAFSTKWTNTSADAAIQGIVWEDFETAGKLYFKTSNGKVWSVQDNGGSGSLVWTKTVVAGGGVSTPIPLSEGLYVGGTDGKIHLLNYSDGTEAKTFIVGDGTSNVGDASSDGYSDRIYVGTEAGKIYRVTLPLP